MDPAPATRRALVVDDESLIRWSIHETLTERGYDVADAETAKEAIRQASGPEPFDLIVLDLRLPDSRDLWLLERLRMITPASKIILMSAYGTPATVERGRRLGANGFLAKPFHLDDLVQAVATA
jgi:DNA-binding NtrC family response regulator